MEPQNDPRPAMRALAERQHGVVSRGQALDAGLTAERITSWRRRGRLVTLHHGVYALGHAALRREGRWLAAVLACGDGAVLSHAQAAAAWELGTTPAGRIHVTTPNRSGRRAPDGVRLHRVRSLPLRETARHLHIPITTPARTLLDLAATLRPRRLEQVVERAEHLGLFDLTDVRETIAVHPTRAGSPALSALLDRLHGDEAAFTRSELEVRLLELCDAHGLPRPRSNAFVAGHEVDFHWPGTALVIETDGWRYHRMPEQREADHAKRLDLGLAGYRVVALMWRQVTRTPERTAGALRRLLARSGSI